MTVNFSVGLYTSLFTGNGGKQWKKKNTQRQTIYTEWSLRIKLPFRCASCSLGILKFNINWHS